jgi:hypothetical protein
MPLTGEGHPLIAPANIYQLLWGANITLRRKLTLTLLFSGAVFIILAGTIRAITILTASPIYLQGVCKDRRLMFTSPSPARMAQGAAVYGHVARHSSPSS